VETISAMMKLFLLLTHGRTVSLEIFWLGSGNNSILVGSLRGLCKHRQAECDGCPSHPNHPGYAERARHDDAECDVACKGPSRGPLFRYYLCPSHTQALQVDPVSHLQGINNVIVFAADEQGGCFGCCDNKQLT
jgi:hypothetical protein